MKRRTVGIDLKVPAQALAFIVAFVAGYFGLDMSAEVVLALSTVIGFFAGYFAPAPKVAEVPVATKDRWRQQDGHTMWEVAMFLLFILVILIIAYWAFGPSN